MLCDIAAVAVATCCEKSCGEDTTLLVGAAWDFTSPESKFCGTKFGWGCGVAIGRSENEIEQERFLYICDNAHVNMDFQRSRLKRVLLRSTTQENLALT